VRAQTGHGRTQPDFSVAAAATFVHRESVLVPRIIVKSAAVPSGGWPGRVSAVSHQLGMAVVDLKATANVSAALEQISKHEGAKDARHHQVSRAGCLRPQQNDRET
jgi:hypothetical protein